MQEYHHIIFAVQALAYMSHQAGKSFSRVYRIGDNTLSSGQTENRLQPFPGGYAVSRPYEILCNTDVLPDGLCVFIEKHGHSFPDFLKARCWPGQPLLYIQAFQLVPDKAQGIQYQFFGPGLFPGSIRTNRNSLNQERSTV